jgi:peptidoglycan/LPS O-acetylase OafA/YrhL
VEKKRNGLLEIYRFFLCFMPLYYHNFFFLQRNYDIFEVPELAVDFFFMLSGFFLMRSMRKLKDEPVFAGFGKIMYGRVKPMIFTLCFIAAFDLICVALFIRENYLDTLFNLFKYWWFVLYLTVGIGILYLVYRLLKKEKFFVVFLFGLILVMTCLHYAVVVEKKLFIEMVFFTRSFGCISAGILLSYIPKISLKYKKFNFAIPIVLILFPTLLYLYYNDKSFAVCLLMILMFGALMYFSTGISVGGRFFDLLGKLSVRMYLYMAFLTMFRYIGLTDNGVLFVLDVAMSVMDLVLTDYREKYLSLKKRQEEKSAQPS